jgi:flagellar hook-associated protein 2
MSTTTSSVSSASTAPITFSGLASGLDTSSIVSKLMAVDQQPITDLQNQETAQTNTLKAYGEVNTLLTTLQTSVAAMDLTSEVRTTAADVSSGSPFTATSTDAFTGSYNISVSQLAQVQKSITGGFASETDGVLGTGTITIGNQTISVDSTNDSLQGIMSSINAVSGTTGVTASIINDGTTTSPYHIVLTGQDASYTFNVSSALQDDSGNAIAFNANTVQTAQQANLTIDGLAVVSNSNTVTGAIAGVTLNLNAVSTSTTSGTTTQYATSQLSITPDTTTLEKNINTFVTNYNAIMNWINAGYTLVSNAAGTQVADPSTAANPTDAQLSQILIGDTTMDDIKNQLQTMISGTVSSSSASGTLNNLSSIGITTNEDGTLSVDTTTLENSLQNNFSGVTNLLAGDGTTGSTGVMGQLNTYLMNLTDPTLGMYAEKKTANETAMNDLENQISVKQEALTQQEATMKAQFTAMELMISNLNSQSGYMATLDGLAGITAPSSSSSSSSASSSSSSSSS